MNENTELFDDVEAVSELYKKEDPITHIIKLPDTYIGSIDKLEEKQWILNDTDTKMIYKNITYIHSCPFCLKTEFISSLFWIAIEFIEFSARSSL